MGDVAHELRTPLAVLRAEIEAVQDGVRPLDRQAADSLHTEVMRLTRLVEDLYQLAMSDLGALSTHKQRVRPADVLQADVQVLAGKFAERNIQVTSALTPVANAEVYADADRLSQLFRNLLQNSLCYTDSGGRLDITGTRIHQALCLDFQDSAPGVAATDLPRLFERFFRVERSRSRHHGGAGIGLALCRRIVEAHGGTIEAQAALSLQRVIEKSRRGLRLVEHGAVPRQGVHPITFTPQAQYTAVRYLAGDVEVPLDRQPIPLPVVLVPLVHVVPQKRTCPNGFLLNGHGVRTRRLRLLQ
jgi:signal transduction histidine kinase